MEITFFSVSSPNRNITLEKPLTDFFIYILKH